ncbi:hypothetical protein VF03_19195 [Nostoc linckia z2]|nr:TIGR03032 family protein [Nostoc linckia]PHJ71913.1 hypothetical protein VF03_19195 [Nostoc linckia z2]
MESFLPRSYAMPSSTAPELEIKCLPHFIPWLQTQFISLAFTTYQTNRLFFIGCNEQNRVSVKERLFDKPMGMYASNNSIYVSTRYQIWRFENLLKPGETVDLLQKCFLQEVGKGKRLKGKGKIPNLSPFPLPLFPTSARSLVYSQASRRRPLSPQRFRIARSWDFTEAHFAVVSLFLKNC